LLFFFPPLPTLPNLFSCIVILRPRGIPWVVYLRPYPEMNHLAPLLFDPIAPSSFCFSFFLFSGFVLPAAHFFVFLIVRLFPPVPSPRQIFPPPSIRAIIESVPPAGSPSSLFFSLSLFSDLDCSQEIQSSFGAWSLFFSVVPPSPRFVTKIENPRGFALSSSPLPVFSIPFASSSLYVPTSTSSLAIHFFLLIFPAHFFLPLGSLGLLLLRCEWRSDLQCPFSSPPTRVASITSVSFRTILIPEKRLTSPQILSVLSIAWPFFSPFPKDIAFPEPEGLNLWSVLPPPPCFSPFFIAI